MQLGVNCLIWLLATHTTICFSCDGWKYTFRSLWKV